MKIVTQSQERSISVFMCKCQLLNHLVVSSTKCAFPLPNNTLFVSENAFFLTTGYSIRKRWRLNVGPGKCSRLPAGGGASCGARCMHSCRTVVIVRPFPLPGGVSGWCTAVEA